jgi:hypothetical protein
MFGHSQSFELTTADGSIVLVTCLVSSIAPGPSCNQPNSSDDAGPAVIVTDVTERAQWTNQQFNQIISLTFYFLME